MIYEYRQRIPVLIGEGAASRLGEKAAEAGCKKVLFVYDKALKEAGMTAGAEESLRQSGVGFVAFDEVKPDAPTGAINAGGQLARREGVDGIVALGGGSCIDTAKGIAALQNHEPPIENYLTGPPTEVGLAVPLFLLPTTSGTGSEVTQMSVIFDEAKNDKPALFLRYVPGSWAIIDPLLTVSAPPSVTAYAGLDALSHTLESIFARDRNPRSEVMSAAALAKIFRWLPIAVNEGGNVEARMEMCLASNWAGLAFADTNVQFGHALADSVSVSYHTPHGLNCAWVAPEEIILYAGALPREARVVAEACGVYREGDSTALQAEKSAAAVRELMRACGVPTMKEKGFDRAKIVAGADYAIHAPLKYNCPIEVSLEEAAEVLGRMYDNY